MAAPWTNDKEEEFVAMMEGKPELFDNTEMNFTNKTAKMNAWLELAKHFQISGDHLTALYLHLSDHARDHRAH